MYSWGQDTHDGPDPDWNRATRGSSTARSWQFDLQLSPSVGFRPVLELPSSDTLGSGGLATVTLDLNGGSIGSITGTVNLAVKSDFNLTLPGGTDVTRPDGNDGTYFMWQDSNGNHYEPGDTVPANVGRLTAIWKDIVNPVITGLENNKTYCDTVEFEASDNVGVASVQVDGVEWTPGANGKYTLAAGIGTVTVVAKDNSDNETSVTVTVNNGHTYEWQSENGQYWKKCKFCDDETAKKDIPTITINGADTVCVTQDYKFSFTLPEGATDAVYGYEFEYMGASGLEPVTEDGKLYGAVPAADYDLSANSFKVTATAKTADGFDISASKVVSLKSEHTDAAPKDHICDICGATLSGHSGGEATCKDKAVCDYCGEEYGALAPNSHADLKHFPAKAATKTAEGNIEYWYCSDCGKYFKDAAATKEIAKADTVIVKLPDDSEPPPTGDNSHFALWLALFTVSAAGVMGAGVYSKRRRSSR